MNSISMVERLNAALEGRYRIERELGAGGMATVYLAEDLKHDRQVAIKVLKPELAAVIGGERFVTEIKTTAALQHPHILPLFDSGSSDGFLYYVMPYVDGESLREKLDREKQLSVDEAVEISAAVASALHYAHEQGVIHRDIKPANILIHAGEPVVADFGIALAISAAGGGRLTETGMSVGTPHYMSPEQASADRDVSARSDTYALACVLYEMLAGEPPHTGSTAQAVLMRILTEEPRDVTDIRKAVPVHVRDALAKALQKLPADRFEDAEAFKRALTDEGFRYRPGTGAARAAAGGAAGGGWLRDPRTIGLLAVVVLVLGWAGIRGAASPEQTLPPVVTFPLLDSTSMNVFVAVSPTGDAVYEAGADGQYHLNLRRAGGGDPVEIPNTEDRPVFPAFSPDGEWVVFVAGAEEDELRKVELATGTAVTLVAPGSVDDPVSPSWTDEGTILFSGDDGIYRMPAIGGTPELLVEGDGTMYPRLLPGGEVLIYTVVEGGLADGARVIARNLETGDTTVVAAAGGNAAWLPTGHIVYGHSSQTLFAVPFDPDRLEVTGEPVPVQENVLTLGDVSFYALSGTGSMAYFRSWGAPLGSDDSEFAWLEGDGGLTPLPLDPTDHPDARLSPDGRFLAYTRDDQIYVYDLDRGTNRRLTSGGRAAHEPVWSPDGRRLAFLYQPEEAEDAAIHVMDVDGAGPMERVSDFERPQYPDDWLPGDTLVFTVWDGDDRDIYLTHIGEPDAEPVALLDADWRDFYPRISPDGRYMAYVSNRSGEAHVYVRRFPDMTGGWQVSDSATFAAKVFWGSDGRSLYYRAGLAIRRITLEMEPSVRAIDYTTVADSLRGTAMRDRDPERGRFLVSRLAEAEERPEQFELYMVVNWETQLRERLEQAGRE